MEPPGDEHQGLGRGPVQRLGVVDQAEQRPLFSHLGQQAEDAQLDQEPARLGVHQPERPPQGVGLGRGQPAQPVHDRPQQLLEAGEGELGLGPGARRAEYPQVAGRLGRVGEQGALADPGLAPNHQGAATPGACLGEQAGDEPALLAPSKEHEHLD